MPKAIKDPEGNETRHLHQFADFAGKRVLEVGCGEGRLTWRYASASSLTVGLDPDRNALRVARIDRPSDLTDKVHFINSQAEHIPFRKETFDIAVLAWSL
ncbi:MAG: class I SAM-dependent methyltransferase [Anaerolineales bacterium]|jgi:ubiquinone/menaquinone biosynthesis C-methylase UbiE|nr:class I SAM-dependent methyltransferase [Anaerolineales bacterium]NTW12017.1 class I SAM-dependent methyltransferase [Anaerolineales bacterium]